MKLRISVICTGLFLAGILPAQERWPLEKCIQQALNNNLTVKQAEIAMQNASLTQRQNRETRFPSFSFNSNLGMNFGRTINPATNSFETQTIGFQSASINGGVLLYGGNQVNDAIAQSRIDFLSAEQDREQIKNDIALNVANVYLNILLAEELVENAKNVLALDKMQLERTDKLIKTGTLAQNERLTVLAQIARDEQGLIAQENAVESGYVTLKQLLLLDPASEIRVVKPNVNVAADIPFEAPSYLNIYDNAINNQPRIKANEFRLKSADYARRIARSGSFPRLSLFGNLNTNFSTLGKKITGYQSILIEQTAYIDNMPIKFAIEQTIPQLADDNYTNQLRENFGQSLGLNLSIPIYNNSQQRIAIQRATLNLDNQRLSNELQKQQLRAEVQTAWINARSARKRWEAAQKAYEAAKTAYSNSEKRFELGAISIIDLNTQKTNMESARAEITQAKYDYIFRLKVLDFYQGKPIILE